MSKVKIWLRLLLCVLVSNCIKCDAFSRPRYAEQPPNLVPTTSRRCQQRDLRNGYPTTPAQPTWYQAAMKLRRYMTGTQVRELLGRPPNKIDATTCGEKTPEPFSCIVWYYEEGELGTARRHSLMAIFNEYTPDDMMKAARGKGLEDVSDESKKYETLLNQKYIQKPDDFLILNGWRMD